MDWNEGISGGERLKLDPAIPEAVMEIAAFWRRRRKPGDSGTIIDTTGCSPIKVGRNDPCPCGAGKKFKQCCGQ
jgi:uncharacterized protein YecA (UPF0149 family)